MNMLWQLFFTFARIGLFTFGGGYAMIALIEDSCVSRKKWITHDEMMNMTVIAESTPGPIAINCATFVGYKQAGFAGALVATLGMILPSFTIIFAISMCLDRFLELTLVAKAFKGIKIAVGVLIFDAAMTMVKKMPKKRFARAVMLSACGVMLLGSMLSLNFSSVSLMLAAGIVSLAIFLVQGAAGRKGGDAK